MKKSIIYDFLERPWKSNTKFHTAAKLYVLVSFSLVAISIIFTILVRDDVTTNDTVHTVVPRDDCFEFVYSLVMLLKLSIIKIYFRIY